MSERPPAGWDTQAPAPAPAPPTVSDEVLAGHLARRGAPKPPRTLGVSIARAVAETDPERRWRLTLIAWRPRVAVAVSGVALVLVAGLLFSGNPAPPTGTDHGSPTPHASATQPVAASQAVAGITWDPTQRALTPPELLRILATDPAPGTVLIVDDQIVPYPVSCTSGAHCPAGQLRNGRGVLVEAPPGGYLTYTQDPGTSDYSVMGPLALQVGPGPNLVFLGAMVSNGLRMSFTAHDLLARSAMGGLFVIPAWLWKTGPIPCPTVVSTPAPMPTSELGLPAPELDFCSGPNYLTDAAPTLPINGSPPNGFEVQHDAYPTFASGADSSGTPRQGVYLVRDWAGYGEILARLEPLAVPSSDANGSASAPPSRPPQDMVLSVDELVARVVGGTLARGSIVVATVPAASVSDVVAPRATRDCTPLCPAWIVSAGGRSISVSVSIQAPIPPSIVGTEAFLVVDGGAVRALGPVSTGAGGAPLDGMTVGDGLSVVAGWLRIGPPLPCPPSPAPVYTGLFGEPLAWSQCPGTWILPTDGDPWAGPPNNVQASDGSGSIRFGDLSVPDGTLHVQDGAGQADLQPREGVWLVRSALTNACPPWAQCPPPSDTRAPQPHVTWYELIGPVIASETSAAGPSVAASPDPGNPGGGPLQDESVVLSQARLVAAVTTGGYPAGTILIARAAIAPVILASLPPDQNTVVGKIGPLRIHWASDPVLGLRDPHPVVVRIRADGELDYLGPATLDGDRSFASSTVPIAQGLLLVHGWFYRPPFALRCLEPTASGTPEAFRTFDGKIQNLACDAAWILPSATDPSATGGGGASLGIPTGSIFIQVRDAAREGPT
ncbi:MAG TPA: hypothetical protein VF323_01840, partial [Candidatus Limnocylindrales bacterium]